MLFTRGGHSSSLLTHRQVLVNVAAGREDVVALNRWKAIEVKKSGFTKEMQDYSEASEQYQRDVVTLKRLAEEERLHRVGPAGGTWGSRPAAMLREPLPLSSVVSAAEAKNQSLLGGGTAALADGTASGGGFGAMSAPRLARGRPEILSPLVSSRHLHMAASSANLLASTGLTPRSLLLAEASAAGLPAAASQHTSGVDQRTSGVDSAHLPGTSTWPSTADHTAVWQDLPVLPFAKGANLKLSSRDKPTGIVI